MRIAAILLMVMFVLAASGCGGSGSRDPLAPDLTIGSTDTAPGLTGLNPGTDDNARMLLGAYNLAIDETGGITITPVRQADAHFDVTKALFPPSCHDCFTCKILNIQGTNWTLLFTLRNPTGLTGYDVRAILLDMGNISLIGVPDSYTEMYAEPEDLTPRNPYFIFDSLTGQNEWQQSAIGSRTVAFMRPPGAKFSEITVVIDTSWPANEDEPVAINDLQLSNGLLYTDGSKYTNLSCQISDWQDDLTSVTVDLSPLGGPESASLGHAVDGTWFLNGIICSPSCDPGPKELWVTATSSGESIYNYTTCTVELPPPPEPAIWTFFVYLHAANLPDDEDINELEMSGSIPGKFNIIVLWDKPLPEETDVIMKIQHDPTGYNLNTISSSIDDNGEVIPPGGLDMSLEETLEAFLLWGIENFPAYHYGLDLWDHGAGIFYDGYIPPPIRNVCGGLTLWEIREACQAGLASQSLVDKIDFIGFDVCVLGWIETAYSLRNVTDVVIASENSEPGPGWDYGPPFINLRNNIETYTVEQLAFDVVEAYVDSYTDPTHPYHYPCDNVTQAASSVDVLLNTTVPALNEFVTVALDYLPSHKSLFAECKQATAYWGWDVSDIGHFAYEVANHPEMPQPVKDAAQNLLEAVDAAMINHGHNNGVPDQESGWTIWFPDDIDVAWPDFKMEYLEDEYIQFSDTLWDEFLYAYAGKVPVIEGWLAIDEVLFSDVTGGNGNNVIEPSETIDVTLRVLNSGVETATNVDGTIDVEAGYETLYDIVEDTSGYPNINAGQTGDNISAFRIHIKPACPSGTTLPVRASFTCDQSESSNLTFEFLVDPGEILIINHDPDDDAAGGIEAACEADGYMADITTVDICDAPFESYQAVFITLGIYDEFLPYYYPTQSDFDKVQGYLQDGGNVYLESGELWAYLPSVGCPDFCPMFGISPLSDGINDLSDIYGDNAYFLAGYSFHYSGDNAYVDQIDALPGAQVVMWNTTPNYGVMVAYDEGAYNTIGASLEFSGLDDGVDPNNKAQLMDSILEFFDM